MLNLFCYRPAQNATCRPCICKQVIAYIDCMILYCHRTFPLVNTHSVRHSAARYAYRTVRKFFLPRLALSQQEKHFYDLPFRSGEVIPIQ